MSPETSSESYKKLAFVGDIGSGKTTIIRTLSQIRTVDTDVRSSVDIGKPLTTVGIDYGRLMLSDDTALGLYGVPGQERFAVLWKHVSRSLWGLVFMLRCSDYPDLRPLDTAFKHFQPQSRGIPFLVALSHVDQYAETVAEKVDIVKAALEARGINVPVLPVDCRERRSALALPYYLSSLHSLLEQAS